MGRYKIVVNPTAGRGNGERIVADLEGHLRQSGVDFDLVRTERQFHAVELAKEAALGGYDVVVAVGGDGTANEVMNGLIQAQSSDSGNHTVMGVLAAGRGNDFAYAAGMPGDLEEACRVLSVGHCRRIDVGHVKGGMYPDGRFFDNSVGIGFDAVVGFEAAKMTRLTGALSYLVAVVKTVFLYFKAPLVQIEYDGETLTLPALMVSIMNGQRQGGVFYMSPEAQNDDGLLDLCVVEEVSKGRIFTLIPHFFKGSQFSQKEIKFLQAKRLEITALRGVLPAHSDGETLCIDGQKLVVELLPGRLDVICPQVDESLA